MVRRDGQLGRAVAATRDSLSEKLDTVFAGRKQIDEELLEQLEEVLDFDIPNCRAIVHDFTDHTFKCCELKKYTMLFTITNLGFTDFSLDNICICYLTFLILREGYLCII